MSMPLAVVLTLWTAVAAAAQTNAPKAEADEYAVYTAVLNGLGQIRSHHLLAQMTEGQKRVGTQGRDLLKESLERYAHFPPALEQEFSARNQTPARLQPSGFPGVAVQILPEAAFHRTRIENLRSHFYPEPCPARGSLRFSRVAFTPDRRQALVYTDYHCGGRCGAGDFILLKRTAEGWQIAEKKRVWIS